MCVYLCALNSRTNLNNLLNLLFIFKSKYCTNGHHKFNFTENKLKIKTEQQQKVQHLDFLPVKLVPVNANINLNKGVLFAREVEKVRSAFQEVAVEKEKQFVHISRH